MPRHSQALLLVSLCLVLVGAHAAENNLMVAYWGQDSSGTEKSLASYCLDSTYDIIVVGFADVWGTGGDLQINLANHCGDVFPGTALLNCPQVGKDIQVCQQKGKRVFLSMGGASGAYGLANDGQAQGLAAQVWNFFLGGSSPTRPFGNAKLDGIDLDIEAGDPSHFGAFVRSLKANFTTDPSKRYYISAAPQCPFPDAYDGPNHAGSALDTGLVDYIWVQFYNNYCNLIGGSFNYPTWGNWAAQSSPNTRVVVGVIGSPRGGSGFADPGTIENVLGNVRNDPQFGGVMVWDASLAEQNNFGQQISQWLK